MPLLNISKSTFSLGALLLIGGSFLFFFYQLFHPQCCDANSYLAIARRYNSEGILEVQNSLRTFAYTWIISIFIKGADFFNIPQIFFIFLVQVIGYYCVILFVVKSFNKTSKLASFLYLSLCANFFLLPYLSVTLTDAAYSMLCLVVIVGIIKSDWGDSSKVFDGKWFFWGSFFVCLAIVIRPAAIWLIVPSVYCVFRVLYFKKINIFEVALPVLLGSILLFFQIVINVINFKKFTFFPIDDLGADQIKWGIQNIKYGTWLDEKSGPIQNFYTSLNLIGDSYNSKNLDISWYFYNLGAAFKLLVFKFVGAFDFDFLIPYPHDKYYYGWLFSFFSFSICWLGIFGTVVHLFSNKLILLGGRFLPILILVSWASISLISALELRFSLPILCYYIVVSGVVLKFCLEAHNKKYLIGLIGGWTVVLPIFFFMAWFIREQSTITANL